jgi:surface polysaccharide O-acyltransferase-like enzyme
VRAPFLTYIHSFRGLAILAVVATHVVDKLTHGKTAAPGERLVYAICQNGTVVFTFIAGFLFQHLSGRYRSYASYLASKLRTVIVPYVVASIPGLLHYATGGALTGLRPIGKVFYLFVALATAAHLPVPYWFVPMIVCIYLGAPLFRLLATSPYLPALVLLGVGLAMFAHRPLNMLHTGHSLLYFTPCYLAGIAVGRNQDHVLGLFDRYRRPASAAVVAAILVEALVLRRGGAIYSLGPFSMEAGVLDIDLPAKLLLGLLAMSWLRRHQGPWDVYLAPLATTSFGIFLVHKYVIDAIFLMLKSEFSEPLPSLVELALIAPTVAGISFAMVEVTRRWFPAWSRYLVGC